MGTQAQTDPTTGLPYGATTGPTTEDATGAGHFGQSASNLSGSSNIDWSKTGWNVDNTGTQTGSQYFRPAANTYGFQIGNQGGYLDPTTGTITYGTQFKDNPGGYGTITTADSGAVGTGSLQQYKYDVNSDYGLGSTATGIIPMQHNAAGQVSEYLAPTRGGGYQQFTDLASAISARDAYKSWYATTQAGQAAAPKTDAASTSPGILTTPGVGEQYYDNTKDFYGQPTNAQGVFNSAPTGPTNAQTVFNETTNQPTNSQQQWNAYSGIYGNPDYLTDYYTRQEQAAEGTLARQQASAGIADSGAAAKTTANLPAVYGDRAIAGMKDFALAGQTMAGSADSANNAQLQTRGSLGNAADTQNLQQTLGNGQLATAADTANLNKTLGGQTSATSAENQMINRETGGLTSATTLANDQASLVSAGLSQADAQSYSSQLESIQLQVQQGKLTAQQAYTQAQSIASSMGVVGNTAFDAFLLSKLGGTGASSGTGAGYTTQTINY